VLQSLVQLWLLYVFVIFTSASHFFFVANDKYHFVAEFKHSKLVLSGMYYLTKQSVIPVSLQNVPFSAISSWVDLVSWCLWPLYEYYMVVCTWRPVHVLCRRSCCVEQSVNWLALTRHLRGPFQEGAKDVSLLCSLL